MDAFLALLIAVITGILSGVVTYFLQQQKFHYDLEMFYNKIEHEFDTNLNDIRTGFMAEQVAKKLLQSPRWEKRSFTEIQSRLKGFSDDELRMILVRAGAVCFTGDNDKELWGLLDRNQID